MAFVQNQQLQGGRYTIERQLKDGRFATTYLAKDKEGKPLVIKTPSEQALRQGNAKKAAKLQDKFWREAAKLATCQHPHIVRAKEPFKEQTGLLFRRTERVCIPMEFIDGKDLENRPAMSAEEALRYIQQIGEALILVHSKGLLHLDVKPANIMVRKDSQEAVLIDFGLAREFDQPLTTINLTTADGFAPPELYDPNAKWGQYTDVYSLAATLYTLLTGKVPPKSVERARIHLIPPQEINAQISVRINEAILWGMELEANRRPQTMRQWLDDVLGVKTAEVVTSDHPVNLAKTIHWDKWQTWLAAVLGIVGIFVAIFGQDIRNFILQHLPKPSQSSSPTLTPKIPATPTKPVNSDKQK